MKKLTVSLENGFFTREIVESMLDEFFSNPKNQEKFLEEFSRSTFQKRLKGTTINKAIKNGTLARKKFVNHCLENHEILKKVASLKLSNGFELPDKITKKEIKKAYESFSLIEILWKLMSKDFKITKGAFAELKRLLVNLVNGFNSSEVNFEGFSEKSGLDSKEVFEIDKLKSDFMEHDYVMVKKNSGRSSQVGLEKYKELKKDYESLKCKFRESRRENRKLKKENKNLHIEKSKLKKLVEGLESKCRSCGGKEIKKEKVKREILEVVSRIKIINSDIQRMLDKDDYGNLKNLLKERERLMKSMRKELEKVGKKVKKLEEQICCYGQPKVILVDAHNLLFRSLNGVKNGKDEKEALGRKFINMPNIERELRNELIMNLYYAAERLNCKIKVYFDSCIGNYSKKLGIVEIFYCFKPDGGADSGLIREMGRVRAGENVLVFSSDRRHIWSYAQRLKKKGKTINYNSAELLLNYLSGLDELMNLENITDLFFMFCVH